MFLFLCSQSMFLLIIRDSNQLIKKCEAKSVVLILFKLIKIYIFSFRNQIYKIISTFAKIQNTLVR